MRTHVLPWLLLAAVAGCDARVDDDYRGESLMRLHGSLQLSDRELPQDAVPALAFEGGGDSPTCVLLDVDTEGEFPANFTIDIMQPPPAAAMRAVNGLPSYAVAYITAVPADHPDEFALPGAVDGKGAFSWCENRDNTDCYRSIEQCVKGTDECYRELARCHRVPVVGGEDGLTRMVCDEILEQSGDPSIAFPSSKFVGLSENYSLLYSPTALPAGAARQYLDKGEERDWPLPFVFGKRPIPAGYTLIRTRDLTEDEQSAFEACHERIENEKLASLSDAERAYYLALPELAAELYAQGKSINDEAEPRRLQRLMSLALFDGECLNGGAAYDIVDPSSASIEVVLGDRELAPRR
jgi:hypothetical protein